MRPRHRLLEGLASLASLAAISFGIPFVLWKIAAWPLPHGVPSVDQVREAFSANDVPDSVAIKAVALIGWCAWLVLALCIAFEVMAWIRGHAARNVLGAGAVQPSVRKLVATAALLLGSSTLHTPTGAGPSALAVAVVSAEVRPIAITSEAPPPAPPSAPVQTQPPAATPKYVVQRRDTLWALAESHLGNPLRWREIYELSRATVQPDGRQLQDPNLIYPGWMLTFPNDATGLAAPASVAVPPNAAPVAATLAAPAVVVPPPTASVVHDESCAAPKPATSPRPAIGTIDGRSSDSHGGAAPTGQSDAPDDHSKPIGPRLIGSTLLAAALVTLLTRLRIVRRRNRVTNPPHKGTDTERVEMLLRREAEPENSRHLDIALRAFARDLSARGSAAMPQLLAARVTEDGVELLLDAPLARAPRGFVDTGLQRTWRTQHPTDWEALAQFGRNSAHPAPALVHIGNRDADEFLIDLETAGMLSVSGEDKARDAFLAHLVNQLTAHPATQHVDVIIVGDEPRSIAGDEYVRRPATIEDAVEELAKVAEVTNCALDECGSEATFVARQRDGGEGWAPTVLICATPVEPDVLGPLLAVARGGRGVAAVIATDKPVNTWHIQLEGNAAFVQPLGLELDAVMLAASSVAAIEHLIDESTTCGAATSEVIELTEAPAEAPISVRVAEKSPEVEVRVLGEVEIIGVERIDRRRSIELITYLACHPEGVTDERLKTILWPDALPAPGTFNTQVSMARSKLGLDVHGQLRLPHISSNDGRYGVSHAVMTDLGRLETCVEHGKSSDAIDAVEPLRDALSCVRGQPFSVRAGYEWAHTEGLVTHAEILVADAAHRLAQLCLELGDPDGAQWAAEQGLKVAHADEALYRDRMLAHDLTGNTSAIESVMRELCEAVDELEPYDSLNPETVELYARLTRRSRVARPRAV